MARTVVSFHPSLTGYVSVAWPERARVAADAGFDAIDIDLWEIGGEPSEAVREVLCQAGLQAGGAALPVEFRRDEDTFRRDVARLPELAELAASIGLKGMSRSIPASGPVPPDELLPILRRRLTTCARILGANGLELALEVLGPLHLRRHGKYELIWRLSDGATFAESCGPRVGVLVDSWHWHHAGDSASDIADLADRILHVHIADAPDLPAEAIDDKRRVLPGEGVVDFGVFLHGLSSAGYSGQVTPEIHGYGCKSTNPVQCARRARAAVSGVLEPATSPAGGGG